DGDDDVINIVNPNDTSDTYDTTLNGRGRMGDAGSPTQGTWQVYNNPKDFLNDPGRQGFSNADFTPIEMSDFNALNQHCTVYTYDTEHSADAPTSSFLDDDDGYRVNFNTLNEADKYAVELEKIIGKERLRSLFNWRDGLVDLNADGDLSDEYILQPVKDPETAEPDTNMDSDSEPVSQITYRERDHINFQDPAQPEYPNMRNIPDLGTLAMVPMSVKETQIIASVETFELGKFDPGNPGTPYTPIPNSGGALACDIDFTGTALVFDTFNSSLDDLYWMNVPRGTNQIQMNNAQGFHPSLSPDGTRFCYVDKDVGAGAYTLSIYDILQDVVVQTNRNGNVPLAIMNVPLGPGGDFFEAGSPDWSPANPNLLAFAGGGTLDFSGDPFSESIHIWTVRLTGPWAGIPTDITPQLTDGMFALYPDFHPDGEWIAYSLIDLNQLLVPGGTPFMVVKQNMVTSNRQILAARADFALLTPDWSPDGRKLCFVGAPVLVPGSTDIWTIGQDGSNPVNISATPGVSELYPSWGWGLTLAASQSSNEYGNVRGTALAYPSGPINPNGDDWDETYRDELAQVLQNASLAFRYSIQQGESGGQSQNWRYMDLPVLPQHVVEPLQIIADSITFRPAYAPRLAGDPQNSSFPQAYAGKININTAPRSVLRALFLLMFQGAVYRDDDGNFHGSAPMVEGAITMGMKPVNLAHRSTNSIERFYALAIADTYANQVVQYRQWIYNNQSRAFYTDAYGVSHTFSITPETVPDGLINDPNGGMGGNVNAKSYRANPFAPYDLDDSPMTQDRQMYDPEPPFRSIADLFNVALYPGEDRANWLHEGYNGDYGPDPEEEVDSRHVIPTSYDPNDPNADGDENGFQDVFVGPNALAVWGPIYQTEFSIRNENHLEGMTTDHILEPFEHGKSDTDKDDPSTRFYKQPRFRLFSADDFKWISPYITTRSYVYRVESRGKVRVANGTNKLDISRDKLWVVDFGKDAYINFAGRDESTDPPTEPIEARWPINGNFNEAYAIRAFEEVPVDGIRLTRGNFTPPKI
ncbi:hypothetical protein KKB99_06775, partial [bacterium]|nr:hypothetical protein [bacterium]MBU1025694.1 hypothetical protein [bacterium]